MHSTISEAMPSTVVTPTLDRLETMPTVAVALARLHSTPNWIEDAACTGADPSEFYPLTDENEDGPDEIKEALYTRAADRVMENYCGECAVRAACLGSAVRRDEKGGVWSAATPAERARLRRLALKNKLIPQTRKSPSKTDDSSADTEDSEDDM